MGIGRRRLLKLAALFPLTILPNCNGGGGGGGSGSGSSGGGSGGNNPPTPSNQPVSVYNATSNQAIITAQSVWPNGIRVDGVQRGQQIANGNNGGLNFFPWDSMEAKQSYVSPGTLLEWREMSGNGSVNLTA